MTDNQRIHPAVEMADHQRIHPIDMGDDEKRDEASTSQLPPADNEFPSQRHTSSDRVPHHPEAPSNRNRCYKCLCWTTIIFIVILILTGAIIGILYLIFRPKAPHYSFDSLTITDFRINPDTTVYARADMTVTSRNPNKRIGIYYERGSNVTVWYNNTILCTGSLPKFYQGHRNTTIVHVSLIGQAQFGRTLVAALEEEQLTGRIPLDFRARVPLRLKLGRLKLWKMRFSVWCNLVVASLSANNVIHIRSGNCHRYKLKVF